MNRTRILAGTALATLAVGSVLALGAQSAGAATGAVTASTHESQDPDTTSGTVTSDPGTGIGYVWAYDNLTKTFTATPNGTGGYMVDETVHGTFRAFSSPNTGLAYDTPISVSGSISGTNEYTVISSTPPQPNSLPAQTLAGTSTSALVAAMFPGSDATVSGGNTWVFTYKAGNAGTMTQAYNTDASSWGNIVGR